MKKGLGFCLSRREEKGYIAWKMSSDCLKISLLKMLQGNVNLLNETILVNFQTR